MINYEVILTYRDSSSVKLNVTEEKLDGLMKDLKQNKMHFNKETNIGFWTTFDQLRHVIVRVKEEKDEKTPKNDINSNKGEPV